MPITRDRGVAAIVGFAALWLVLALIVSDTTFHLAPAIVGGAGAFGASRHAARAAALGVGTALLVGAVLIVLGRLDGPSLLPWGGARLETGLAAIAGGMLGLAIQKVSDLRVSATRP